MRIDFSRMAPRSVAASVALFALGYLIWQPAAQFLLHVLVRQPIPFSTAREWRDFLGVATAIGAGSGWLWFATRRMSAESWARAVLESGLTMLVMSVMLAAAHFTEESVVLWVTGVVLASALTGLVWSPLFRWATRSKLRD